MINDINSRYDIVENDAKSFNLRCISNFLHNIFLNTKHIKINKIIHIINKINDIDIDIILNCSKYPSKNTLFKVVSIVGMITVPENRGNKPENNSTLRMKIYLLLHV